MPSTRNRSRRSVGNGNQCEVQQETPPSRNLRSTEDANIDAEDYESQNDANNESKKVVATRKQSSNKRRVNSGGDEGKKSSTNGSTTALWEDQVFDFLMNYHSGMLDEDEVVSRTNRMVRSASQQFDSARSVIKTVVDDSALFEACCEEAQHQAVIDDLLKDIFGTLTSLDRRAVSWIKRTVGASGRRQKSKHGLLLGNTRRRLTRETLKTTTVNKNEDIFYDAIREIEREKGLTRRNERRLSASSYSADDEGNRHRGTRHKRRVNGEHSAASSNKRSRIVDCVTPKDRPLGEPVLDLVALESSRQKILTKLNKVDNDGGFLSFVERSRKTIPSAYTKMGIIHRLPEWNEIQTYIQKIDNIGLETLLREQMKGQLTRFLVCEYFYSDLDRAWFEREKVHVTQRDRAGLPITSFWKASDSSKRKRNPQTRRFTKRFIRDEMVERNRYRQAVRFFQQHDKLLDRFSFPYDVAKPIALGTSVAAWNKTTNIICRGTVIGHNVAHGTYTVDFGENGEERQEVPDSHVATIGGPEKREDPTAAPTTDSFWEERKSLSLLDDASIKAQLLDELLSLSRFNPSRRPHRRANRLVRRTTEAEHVFQVKDEVAERDALRCLIDSVDKLLQKKTILLEHLEGLADSTQEDWKTSEVWLRDNCKKIDEYLNTLLCYVERFYGAAYLPNHHGADQTAHPRSRDGFKGAFDKLSKLLLSDNVDCNEIGHMFVEFSSLSADHLISEVHEPVPNKSRMNHNSQTSTECGNDVLSFAGRILLASSFAKAGIISNQATAAVSSRISHSAFDGELGTYPHGNDDDEFMASAHSARREAISDLMEAAALFHAEVALAAL